MITPCRIARTAPSIAALGVLAVFGLGLTGCGNGLQLAEPPPDRGSVVSEPGNRGTDGEDDGGGRGSPDGGPAKTEPADPTDDPGSGAARKDVDPDRPVSSGDHPGNDDARHNGQDGNRDDGRGNDDRDPDDRDDPADPTGAGHPANPGNPGSSDRCTLDDLAVTVDVPEGGGAAGSQYVVINFTNMSGSACLMKGYAGVSFVGHQDGTQLGEPARRTDKGHVGRVHLAPGAQVTEVLQIANAGNWEADECAPTTADGFRIYPPGSYTAAYVPFEHQACRHRGIVQLTVYPIGSR